MRKLCRGKDGSFLSSSKDNTVKVWSPDSEVPNGYKVTRTLYGHQDTRERGGVAGLCYIPPGHHSIYVDGAILTGGYDRMVLIWDGEGGEAPSIMLIGHEGAILCVQYLTNGDIVSGSSDK